MNPTFLHEPPVAMPTSPRALAVLKEFKVDPADLPKGTRLPLEVPARGELLFLSGASGSGKSTLLRRLVRTAKRRGAVVIDLPKIRLPGDRPTLDVFGTDEPIGDSLRRLARVGLAELWTWLRPPKQLSEGQRWRLRLAVALAEVARHRLADREVILVCDEFAAVLDRVSAWLMSGLLRRLTRSEGFAAAVATSHDDLAGPLAPDVTVRCDFGVAEVARAATEGTSCKSRSPG